MLCMRCREEGGWLWGEYYDEGSLDALVENGEKERESRIFNLVGLGIYWILHFGHVCVLALVVLGALLHRANPLYLWHNISRLYVSSRATQWSSLGFVYTQELCHRVGLESRVDPVGNHSVWLPHNTFNMRPRLSGDIEQEQYLYRLRRCINGT